MRCELKELVNFLEERGDDQSAIVEASLAYKNFLKSDEPLTESVIDSPIIGTPRRSPTIRKLRRLSTIQREVCLASFFINYKKMDNKKDNVKKCTANSLTKVYL